VRIEELRQKTVLDVGCGQGLFSAILRQQVAPELYVGIDFSSVLLKKATRRSPSHSFVLADAEKLPIGPHSVDYLFSTEVIEHIADYRSVLAEFCRALKKEGVCIITTPNFQGLLGVVKILFEWSTRQRFSMGSIVEYAFTPERLKRELLRAGFARVEIRGIDLKGNIPMIWNAALTLLGGILRRIGLYYRLKPFLRVPAWEPPEYLLKSGLKADYTPLPEYLIPFGTGIGAKAAK
jgi:SAM-dependent methyltransferase